MSRPQMSRGRSWGGVCSPNSTSARPGGCLASKLRERTRSWPVSARGRRGTWGQNKGLRHFTRKERKGRQKEHRVSRRFCQASECLQRGICANGHSLVTENSRARGGTGSSAWKSRGHSQRNWTRVGGRAASGSRSCDLGIRHRDTAWHSRRPGAHF